MLAALAAKKIVKLLDSDVTDATEFSEDPEMLEIEIPKTHSTESENSWLCRLLACPYRKT